MSRRLLTISRRLCDERACVGSVNVYRRETGVSSELQVRAGGQEDAGRVPGGTSLTVVNKMR
jgi:hypothetical protein